MYYLKKERILGVEYYRKTDKCVGFDKYRVETAEPIRKCETDYTPYEILSIVKGALEDKVALYMDEIQTIVASIFSCSYISERAERMRACTPANVWLGRMTFSL